MPQMSRERLREIVRYLKKGGASLEDANEVIAAWVKSNGSMPVEQALIEVELAFKTSKQRALTVDVAEFVAASQGFFSVSDCFKEVSEHFKAFQGVSPDIRRQIRVILHRMVERKLLERHRTKDGWYRRVQNDAPLIAWQEADIDNVVEVLFPFGLHRFVKIYPKNLIVIAGAPDAGKTAYMLNFIRLNQDRFPIVYFSSEMAEEELKVRLSKFGEDIEWKFEPRERAFNFADVIQEDKINIIDYLEITTDFHLIAEELKNIWGRLRKGIALIAIQKKRGAEMGRGAEFGLEKPRLYLTMDTGCLKIIKAKNWMYPTINPNSAQWRFRLHNGTDFEIINEPDIVKQYQDYVG